MNIPKEDRVLAVIIVLSFVSLIALGVNIANASGFENRDVTQDTYPVYFDQGKSTLRNVAYVKKIDVEDADVKVVGYASSEGDRGANARLSTARAMAVAGVLSVDATIDSHGEAMASQEADPKDRRVDIIVTRETVALNPIYGGYTDVMGPTQHLQWNTLPR